MQLTQVQTPIKMIHTHGVLKWGPPLEYLGSKIFNSDKVGAGQISWADSSEIHAPKEGLINCIIIVILYRRADLWFYGITHPELL